LDAPSLEEREVVGEDGAGEGGVMMERSSSPMVVIVPEMDMAGGARCCAVNAKRGAEYAVGGVGARRIDEPEDGPAAA
jgi:hypothetical protein